MDTPKPSPHTKPLVNSKSKSRISTQIHRRNKAKAVFPMTDEWQDSTPMPLPHLRTPSDKMGK
ncbi:MAG: hypothetical protein GKS05_01740 [Nitrospirales bacterium]|nr:hypothetical protein [Nitrospirales bacterium]